MAPRFDGQGFIAACLGLAILACLASPVAAQSSGLAPTYADGQIHCPDGSTHEYTLGVPDTLVLRLACRTSASGASAATPKPIISDDLPSLRHPPSDGKLRCPDGSTRSWNGEPTSDLVVKMACGVPADVAVENHRRAQMVLDKKNEEDRMRAALRGDAGVWEGLKASWKAHSLDYVLSFRAAWFVGIVLLLFGLVRIFAKK